MSITDKKPIRSNHWLRSVNRFWLVSLCETPGICRAIGLTAKGFDRYLNFDLVSSINPENSGWIVFFIL
jgi:hypothetical protein